MHRWKSPRPRAVPRQAAVMVFSICVPLPLLLLVNLCFLFFPFTGTFFLALFHSPFLFLAFCRTSRTGDSECDGEKRFSSLLFFLSLSLSPSSSSSLSLFLSIDLDLFPSLYRWCLCASKTFRTIFPASSNVTCTVRFLLPFWRGSLGTVGN